MNCLTCSDAAQPGQVEELLPHGLAWVRLDGELQEVSLELVDARVGDTVLVHAGVALAKLP